MFSSVSSATLLVLLFTRLLCCTAGPSGFGNTMNVSYTLFSPTEAIATDHQMLLLNNDTDELYAVVHSSPRGSDASLVVGNMSYDTWSSRGVPSCLATFQPGAVPSTLFNIAPFESVGASMVRGQETTAWRYDTGPYHISTQLSAATGLPVAFSNPGLYSDVWDVYHFDNASTSVDAASSAFSVPAECLEGRRAVAAVDVDAIFRRGGKVPPPPMTMTTRHAAPAILPANAGGNEIELSGPHERLNPYRFFNVDAAAAAARGVPSWAVSEEDAVGEDDLFPSPLRSSRHHVRDRNRNRNRNRRWYEPSAAVLQALPAAMDNRAFAPPVRDQTSTCGGCWAFSSAAATEVVWNVARGTRSNGSAADEHFSPQQLLDCVPVNASEAGALIDSKGCHGGWPFTGLAHVVERGFALDRDYPFAGATGSSCLLDADASRQHNHKSPSG
jgi:hypothetical protein